MNRIFTSPRPLHCDWLCVTLLTTTWDVTVTLFIDKVVKQKEYHIELDKLYTNICYVIQKSRRIINFKHWYQYFWIVSCYEKKDCKLLRIHAVFNTFFSKHDKIQKYWYQYLNISNCIKYINPVLILGYATSQGLSESMVGVLVGCTAFIGMVAAIAYPFIRRRIGLVRTGVLAVTSQVSCLCLCVISLWMPGGTFNSYQEFGTGSALPQFNCSSSIVSKNFTDNTPFIPPLGENVALTNYSVECNTTSLESSTNQNTFRASIFMLMMGIVGARFGKGF